MNNSDNSSQRCLESVSSESPVRLSSPTASTNTCEKRLQVKFSYKKWRMNCILKQNATNPKIVTTTFLVMMKRQLFLQASKPKTVTLNTDRPSYALTVTITNQMVSIYKGETVVLVSHQSLSGG